MPSPAMTIHGHASAGASLIGPDLPSSTGAALLVPAGVGRDGSRIAIGIRGAVATLQPDLVRQLALRPGNEELRIERDAALRSGVELHHPAVEPALVEL